MVPLFTSLAWSLVVMVGGESECLDTSMLQTQMLVYQRTPMLHPWEVNNYVMAGYHKSGIEVSGKILATIFLKLGASQDDKGILQFPCYQKQQAEGRCYNFDAPIMFYIDSYNATYAHVEKAKSAAENKGLRVAVSVRNPMEMVASGYCYHHEGQERTNRLFNSTELLLLGPEEGTRRFAEQELFLVETMVNVIEHSDENTMRLTYEDLTRSSSGFDAEIQRLMDHYFGVGPDALISMEERNEVATLLQLQDLNRNPEADMNHSTDGGCKEMARNAMKSWSNTMLYKKYEELAERLGY